MIKPKVPNSVVPFRIGITGQPNLMATADCFFGCLGRNQISDNLAFGTLDFWHNNQESIGALDI